MEVTPFGLWVIIPLFCSPFSISSQFIQMCNTFYVFVQKENMTSSDSHRKFGTYTRRVNIVRQKNKQKTHMRNINVANAGPILIEHEKFITKSFIFSSSFVGARNNIAGKTLWQRKSCVINVWFDGAAIKTRKNKDIDYKHLAYVR